MPDNGPAFRGELWFCSNMYPCQVTYKGVDYPSSEHIFQTWKTLDPVEQDYINFHRSTTVFDGETFEHCRPTTPQEAKRLAGRKSERPITLRPDWKLVRLPLMEEVIEAKFRLPELRTLLLATGDRQLSERNPWADVFFGVCNGKGEDHLGRLLMERRTLIREKPAS